MVLSTFLLLTVTTGCSSRTTEEQQMFDHGYEFADGVIEVDQLVGGDVMEQCVVNANLIASTTDNASALLDGCQERIDED
jgi:hypothetical protein